MVLVGPRCCIRSVCCWSVPQTDNKKPKIYLLRVTHCMLAASEITALVPVLRPECAAVGVFEPDAMSMDVAALHEGYLRGFRTRGGVVTTDAEVLGLTRKPGGW